MKWYHFLAAFFAGAFLFNAIPHLVNGVSGDAFPSPFANPPGKGLSSPMVNVAWGFFNLIVGYILLLTGKVKQNRLALAVFTLAGLVMCLMLADNFSHKLPG